MSADGFPTLAMLPWLKLKDRVSLGNVDFIPWRMEDGMTETLFVSESTVKQVMSSYVDIDGSPINHATIALHHSAKAEGVIVQEQVDEIIATAQYLAFALIADNNYFCQIGKYTNAACFTVVFQRLTSDGGIVLTTRRRAGRLLDAGYSYGAVRFSIPEQCRNIGEVQPEKDMVDGLTAVVLEKTPASRRLLRAIRLFTLAYTDDSFMPQEQEVILLMMAYEGLFKNCQGRDDLACKVSARIDEYGMITIGESKRMTKMPKRLRPEMWLHRAWVQECYGLRSDYVHGNKVDGKTMTWSPFEHVVFASWLFPFLVKRLIADEGLYRLSRQDLDSLYAVDNLLHTADWPGGSRNQTNWQSAMELGQSEALRREAETRIREYDIIQEDDDNENGAGH